MPLYPAGALNTAALTAPDLYIQSFRQRPGTSTAWRLTSSVSSVLLRGAQSTALC